MRNRLHRCLFLVQLLAYYFFLGTSQAQTNPIKANLQNCAAEFGSRIVHASSGKTTPGDHFNIHICYELRCTPSDQFDEFSNAQLHELFEALTLVSSDETLLKRLKSEDQPLNIQIRFLDRYGFHFHPYPLHQRAGTSTIVFYVPQNQTSLIRASEIYDFIASNRHRPLLTRIYLNTIASIPQIDTAAILNQKIDFLKRLPHHQLIDVLRPQIENVLGQFSKWLEKSSEDASTDLKDVLKAMRDPDFKEKLAKVVSQNVTIDSAPLHSPWMRIHFAIGGAVVRNHHRIIVTFSLHPNSTESENLIRLQSSPPSVLDFAFVVLGASSDTFDDISVNVQISVEDLLQAALQIMRSQ